jgi:hypothetical protein
MSPWFRRRRSAPEPPAPEPAEEPSEELDPTGPLSPERLEQALKRLRQEIPAPSEESPPGPSE